jgi:serine/threonine protein kinase
LVNEHGRAKLADFGLAEMLYRTEAYSHMGPGLGTIPYMAPELLDPEVFGLPEADWGKRTTASDLYALGITTWEVSPLFS